MSWLASRFTKSESVVTRQIAGEVILVPIRHDVADLEGIYILNETAARVWDLVDGQRSALEIRNQIQVEYEVEADQADADLADLLAQLEAIGAVERV